MAREVSLALPADLALGATIRDTCHNAAAGFGFADDTALGLAQSVHDVFEFVASVRPGTAFHLTIGDRGHCVDADVRCDLPHEDLHWLSTVRPIDLDDDDALRALGLIISSRLVDRFSVTLDAVGSVVLRLSKDRPYETAAGARPSPPPAPGAPADDDIHSPSDAQLIRLAGVFRAVCTGGVPLPFRADARAVDMRAAGDLDAVVVSERGGAVTGGIAWARTTPRLVTVFGPVTTAGRASLPGELVQQVVRRLARTDAVMIVSERMAPGFPADQFERLGTIGDREMFFRSLEEDPGGYCWTDAATRPFLEAEQQRLFLPRDVLDAATVREPTLRKGLLGAETDRSVGQITLRPLVDGLDMAALLTAHVDRCRRDGYSRILLETDHGLGWQARLGRAILAAGFTPCVLLPNAATGDVVVWKAGQA
jgi:hypothetical protein